jgi:hypothetical protein
VQTALDAEDTQPVADSAGRRARLLAATVARGPVRPVPGLQADQAVSLAVGGTLTATCRQEVAADSAGETPYAPFLALASFEPSGALGGPVVFARDLGARNALLRSRFPGRIWYRYRPRQSLDDTTAALEPYH